MHLQPCCAGPQLLLLHVSVPYKAPNLVVGPTDWACGNWLFGTCQGTLSPQMAGQGSSRVIVLAPQQGEPPTKCSSSSLDQEHQLMLKY